MFATAAFALAIGIASATAHSHEVVGGEDASGMVGDRLAPNFTLIDQNGHRFRLSDQRGFEVVLFFGFAHCDDVCPATMARLARIVSELSPPQRARVRVAFITVDPERDDRAALRHYVRMFDPSFYGLTGTRAQLEPVYHDYGVYHKKKQTSANDYEVVHGTIVYFIDPRGVLRVERGARDTDKNIARDVRRLAS